MVGRVKFEVFGKNGWCTAYATPQMLEVNRLLFLAHGFRVRIDGNEYSPVKQAA